MTASFECQQRVTSISFIVSSRKYTTAIHLEVKRQLKTTATPVNIIAKNVGVGRDLLNREFLGREVMYPARFREAHNPTIVPYDEDKHKEIIDLLKNSSLSIEDLRGHIGISWDRLNREFEKRENRSMGDYRRKYQGGALLDRLATAHSLLQDTRLSIEDVASKLGYQLTTSFYRAYKEKTGKTPQEYRDQYVEKHNKSLEQKRFWTEHFKVAAAPKFQEMVDYLNAVDIQSGDIDLEEMARKFSVSAIGNLSTSFSRAAGIRISDFIRQRRIEIAMEALAMFEGRLDVNVICRQVGVKDAETLRNNFKKVTGETMRTFLPKVRQVISDELQKLESVLINNDNLLKGLQNNPKQTLELVRNIVMDNEGDIRERTCLRGSAFYEKLSSRLLKL